MTRRQGRSVEQGTTLVELMVSLVIAALIALAIVGTLAASATSRRQLHSVVDIDQAGAFAIQVLDRSLRSAGSGFAQSASSAYGCSLYASRANAQILPVSSSVPAPFAGVDPGQGGVFRLAPVVVAAAQSAPGDSGQASDVLIVMSGEAGLAEAGRPFDALSTSNTLTVRSTLGLASGDLLLVVDPQRLGGACLLTQVSGVGGARGLTLGGSYYASVIGTTALTDVSRDGLALDLGNPGNGNAPRFHLIGVGEASTLYAYDLLQIDATAALPMAAGVFELHALYGLDNDGDQVIDTWMSPATPGYRLADLMDGSSTASAKLRRIRALRIGLILRAGQIDRSRSAPSALTLFADLGADLQFTRTLSADERAYRYRTVETTVPLRNAYLAQ